MRRSPRTTVASWLCCREGLDESFGCLETLKDANSGTMSAEKCINYKLYSCQIQSDFRTKMYGNALET